MEIKIISIIALAAAGVVAAILSGAFNLQVARATEALFDAVECKLAERQERRALYAQDEQLARPVAHVRAAHTSGLTLVARRDQIAA